MASVATSISSTFGLGTSIASSMSSFRMRRGRPT
jgi:hypothetical protein